MDHTLSQLQALLDEAERTQTSVSASSVGQLQALASQAARLGSGSYLAIEYRAIFPLLELPGSVVSLILSHLPAARLAACMPTCRAFQRHLGEAAISMRLTRLEQVLPTVQPGEAVTHALRFAEMLAASPPATLGAGESHTLCLGREGVLLSCGGYGLAIACAVAMLLTHQLMLLWSGHTTYEARKERRSGGRESGLGHFLDQSVPLRASLLASLHSRPTRPYTADTSGSGGESLTEKLTND